VLPIFSCPRCSQRWLDSNGEVDETVDIEIISKRLVCKTFGAYGNGWYLVDDDSTGFSYPSCGEYTYQNSLSLLANGMSMIYRLRK